MENDKSKIVPVTRPSLTEVKEFMPYLEKIWKSKWLTNNGQFHQQLEKELAVFLGVEQISLFNNGTIALMVALKALDISGEVITTPFSFVATANSIVWNNCKPVFGDIDSQTFNLDPDKIEKLITPETTAIMPVHVYGNPCDNDEIEQIAAKNNLKVIYDAAHAFNVKKKGESILNWGDLSVLSFHATKVFNTFEGGAIVCHSKEMKGKIDRLKNFGFVNETQVNQIGINGKMNEIQAAFGLLQLQYVEKNIKKRSKIAELYSSQLKNVDGITIQAEVNDIDLNYSYYPVLIDKDKYSLSRDELYDLLKENNIFSRRYFYPLISNFSTYHSLPSARIENLPTANKIAEKVLCLPIYPELEDKDIGRVIEIIRSKI
ncbi:MAG: DegT/DnrJ/EryC1/StrS family aminotransferase [Ignavibacteriales bacterium]|nr:DegT/DnrJ/EryC1/StrS family aminotransferase [Ignavibacteriales bacterium]